MAHTLLVVDGAYLQLGCGSIEKESGRKLILNDFTI